MADHDHILMLDSIMVELRQKCRVKGDDCDICARMAETIEAAKAALSHAAGQEAEFPECSGDPTDCPENEGHGCCKLKKGWCEKHSRHEPCESCTDKAQPSTSAEVGRDAEDKVRRDSYDVGWIECANWAGRDDLVHDMGSPAYLQDRARNIEALTASSGREG